MNGNKSKQQIMRVLAASSVVAAGNASAALVTTDITGAITDAATAGGVIGIAVLVMMVGFKVFKWVRKTL
jgi:hypothetical protein